jgi:DNA-directed RNA polymerase subunit RPC12/RpoP
MKTYGFTCSSCGRGVDPESPTACKEQPNYCRYCGAKLSASDIQTHNSDNE